MPEGPELKFLSIYYKKLEGQFFNSIESNTKSTVKIPQKSKIENIYSYGKYLIIKTKNYYVIIHLGITGWLVEEQPKIYKYIFNIGNEKIYLKDRRRFSKVWIIKNEEDLKGFMSKLGVDILSKEFTLDYFENILISKKKMLCSLLLDQKYFAGLGNYIKNDALYLTGLHPDIKSNSKNLNKTLIKKLYENIRFIAFSSLMSQCKYNKLKIPVEIKKISPKKLEIPYHFRVYERESTNKDEVITYLKQHCGRRTYYVKTKQIIT